MLKAKQAFMLFCFFIVCSFVVLLLVFLTELTLYGIGVVFQFSTLVSISKGIDATIAALVGLGIPTFFIVSGFLLR